MLTSSVVASGVEAAVEVADWGLRRVWLGLGFLDSSRGLSAGMYNG